MLIHQLKPKVTQRKKKRLGRGSSSGHGKTSGRGHKGYRSRSGSTYYRGFVGGRMRLVRKLPKVGFNTYKKTEYQIVNLDDISKKIKKDVGQVTPEILKQSGLIKSEKKLVKILGDGVLNRPLSFEGCRASASAVKKIQEAGGKIALKA